MTDQKPVNEVAIELCYLDEKLEKKKGGGQWKIVKEKLNAPHHLKNWWNTFFILSCAFAVFNDPMFCYIYAIDFEKKCMTKDDKLADGYIWGRLATDVFYLLDVIISKCGCCCKKGKTSCSTRIQTLFSTLSRIFLSLPFAEILYVLYVELWKDSPSSSLGVFFIILAAIQYMLRIYYFYDSVKWRSIIDLTRVEKWVKPILDFVPFILTSYLVGALWHLFATRKQVTCWVQKSGINENFFRCNGTYPYLGNDTYPNISLWEKSCPLDQADPSKYDFGIYFYALQSQVTSSKHHILRRVFQSLCWALRNLSSFGSNLNNSMDWLEIAFCISISIGGMALFLVYLNARVEESKKRNRKDILEKKKKLMTPDIDLWLSKQDIPKKMKASTKKKEEIKSVIMKNIHKLKEYNDLDVQNILSILPIKDKINTISFLFLGSLEKVPMLQNMNEKVLKAICHHLVPVTYTEGSHIIQEGNPFGKFLLITQGVAVTYSNSGSSSNEWLNKGDSYGEELLSWAFNPSYMNLPISTRNVIAQEKVEAFAIRANDLKSVFDRFWWVFSKEVDASQLDQYEHLATSSLLAIRHRGTHLTTYKKRTWRHWYGRATTGPIRWDRFELS